MKPKRLYLLAVIVVIGLFSIAQAEKRPAALDNPQQSKAPQPSQPAPEANNIKFPYVGEITGTEINIRSGPGMNFYSCSKINAPARVVVVDQKYSWAKVLPPPGSFSWIFRQSVQTDSNNPGVGVVNGDNVRVYAGSDELEPMRSDSVQISLSTGQKVRIIGEPVGDYYKIAPPEGTTLWTTSQYIKYIRSADEIDIKIPQSEDANTTKPEMIIEQVEVKSQQLEQYYTLRKQLDDEKAKPLEQQDYTKIKAEAEALIADANSGNAGDYAKYLLKDIQRCEIAKESKGVVESQKTELQQAITEAEKEHQEKLQNIPDIGKYAIMGTFKQSLIYEGQPGGQRFLIVDDGNNPICYAEPVGEMADANLTDYYGQKVGLIGQISADNQSHLALVRFEKIEKLEKEATEK
jgi:uncharacterized protein YgiM (DUF1202 family)